MTNELKNDHADLLLIVRDLARAIELLSDSDNEDNVIDRQAKREGASALALKTRDKINAYFKKITPV